jgi:hypothetical protein
MNQEIAYALHEDVALCLCPITVSPFESSSRARANDTLRLALHQDQSDTHRRFWLEKDTMSARTIYLGKLIGLYCVLLALVLISHKQASVDMVTALVHDAPVLFVVSLMAMVAGLAIVLAHNVWSGGALPVVVTLVGWISLIKGLIFLLLPPDTSFAYFEALRYGQFFYGYMSITLVLGIYLTFSAFRSSV